MSTDANRPLHSKPPCKITQYGARWWGDSRSDVPFTRIRGGLTFLIEQFGGGLPGRPMTRKESDARFIFGDNSESAL